MIIVKDKVHISIVIKISFSLENGLMTNLRQVFILKLKMMKLKLDQRDHTSRILMYFHKFLS